MAQANWQKVKLLKLVTLLQQETDEQHPLTTSEICSRLECMGIPCDRRTLSKDIAVLNETGTEIMWIWVGKEKGYYVEDRSFSVPELKILIDAVQAASFITEKKTAELTYKIADLGGSNRAEVLTHDLVQFNTRKHSNEHVYYNVDTIEKMLQEKKRVSFQYFDLGIGAQRIYRMDGYRYTVDPIALVFNEDNYYLVSYSSKHDSISSYRVDRMEAVEANDKSISEKALALRDKMGEHTEQAFRMHGGKHEIITLEFDKSLTGVVYDRFGEDTRITEAPNGSYMTRVQVQISPSLWGWLIQFAGKMRIISPEWVIDKYQAHVKMALNDDTE